MKSITNLFVTATCSGRPTISREICVVHGNVCFKLLTVHLFVEVNLLIVENMTYLEQLDKRSNVMTELFWTELIFLCVNTVTGMAEVCKETKQFGLHEIRSNIYIQGVPGGKDLTSGECSLGQNISI